MSEAAKEQVVGRETGRVKWFNPSKGFGFINLDGSNDSIFVHFSNINIEGFKTLDQDAEVTFEIEQTPKGLTAVNVVSKRK